MDPIWPQMAGQDDVQDSGVSVFPDPYSVPSWPSPYSLTLTFDGPFVQHGGFSMDDMMLDVFNTDANADEMEWSTSRSMPDTSSTTAQHRAVHRSPRPMIEMQTKFSIGRRPYHVPQSSEKWESRKAELQQLYIHEDKTLKEIISIMKSKGFSASAKMYKTRFKQWGFVKNNTREDVAKMIHAQRQRAAIGKPTMFERNGKVVRIDKYLKKNRIVPCYMGKPATLLAELPGSVRCRTPNPEALPTPGPLVLKELLMQCLKGLQPSFSRLSRPADGKPLVSTELWDTPRYLKLACDLFSDKRNKQAGSICNSAFKTVHALVRSPRLDTLFNFIVSQLWWANRDITVELWRYLAAYMSDVLGAKNEIYHLLRGFVCHIESHGFESYLDFMTECIDDILRLHHWEAPRLWWPAGNSLVGWCQLIVMDCYFLNGFNKRGDRIQARCALALPRSSFFPDDRKINEQIWRETFEAGGWTQRRRHDRFLKLAFASYAKLLGRLNGAPAMHPSLTHIEGVARSLSRRDLEPLTISKHHRGFALENKIMSFLTRDLSKADSHKSVDCRSFLK